MLRLQPNDFYNNVPPYCLLKHPVAQEGQKQTFADFTNAHLACSRKHRNQILFYIEWNEM
jgi:hypothetical protein